MQDVWTNLGANCKRVFGSGAFKKVGEEFEGDVRLEGLKIECKRRKSGNGFKSLYDWFEQDDADMLVVRADRKNRLYVLPEKLMIEMAQKMGWLEKKEKK